MRAPQKKRKWKAIEQGLHPEIRAIEDFSQRPNRESMSRDGTDGRSSITSTHGWHEEV